MNETILKAIIQKFGKENIVLMNWEPYGKMVFSGEDKAAFVIKDEILYMLSDAVGEKSDLKMEHGVRLDAIHTSKVSLVTAMYNPSNDTDKQKVKQLVQDLGFTDNDIKAVFGRDDRYVTIFNKAKIQPEKQLTVNDIRIFTAATVGEMENGKLVVKFPAQHNLEADDLDKISYKVKFRLYSHLNNVDEFGEMEIDGAKTKFTSKEELKIVTQDKYVNQKFYLELSYELEDGTIRKFGPYNSTSMVAHKN